MRVKLLRVKLLKDGIEVFIGSKDNCEMLQFLLKELKPQHTWTIENEE